MTGPEIKALVIAHGFTERQQPDGAMDLNPYVYAFAESLISAVAQKPIRISTRGQEANDWTLDMDQIHEIEAKTEPMGHVGGAGVEAVVCAQPETR